MAKRIVGLLLTEEENNALTDKAVLAGFKKSDRANYIRSLLGFARVNKGKPKKKHVAG